MHNTCQIVQVIESCMISYSSIEIQMATGHDDKQRIDT